ncbi:MAG: HisA/HisF-related TIM barrel protein, partial [Desulfobulbaceae bacterium]
LPDLTLAKKLEDAGAAAVMPLGAPIGTNRGLETRELIAMLIEICKVPVIVDAGIGQPSHAAEAMEMGADAVLVNTAIATAEDPVQMGLAFSLAVRAGRLAYIAKIGKQSKTAQASSPLTGFLN